MAQFSSYGQTIAYSLWIWCCTNCRAGVDGVVGVEVDRSRVGAGDDDVAGRVDGDRRALGHARGAGTAQVLRPDERTGRGGTR